MSDTASLLFHGGCLCGEVRYVAEGPPVVVAVCYCGNCQKGSGADHTTGAMFAADKFQLTGRIAEYQIISDHGNEVTRAFCPECGSPILGRNTGMAGFVTVALGTFDNSVDLTPQVAIFARNRKPWDELDDAVLRYDTQPDWKPGA